MLARNGPPSIINVLSLCLFGKEGNNNAAAEHVETGRRSKRFPFSILQVSLSLGASVFIGAYLRKPTSKEGSGVYLTMGNLKTVRLKTEEMVPVRQQTAGAN